MMEGGVGCFREEGVLRGEVCIMGLGLGWVPEKRRLDILPGCGERDEEEREKIKRDHLYP